MSNAKAEHNHFQSIFLSLRTLQLIPIPTIVTLHLRISRIINLLRKFDPNFTRDIYEMKENIPRFQMFFFRKIEKWTLV